MSISKISAALTTLLAIAILAYAGWLLSAGVEITTMMENSSAIQVSRAAAPAAWVPLLAAAAILWGQWRKQAAAYWAGAIVLLAFSLLFLFSIGGGLLLPALAILILLLITRSFRK
ncbi:MAG: hypothetical protein KIS85_05895 [Anaerolineales bacterium]|nr:hypothetical protein [Anaerolineales bacterium]